MIPKMFLSPVLLWGLTLLPAFSQTATDTLISTLTGRWYKTQTWTDSGAADFITLYADDSIKISRKNSADSIIWKTYNDGYSNTTAFAVKLDTSDAMKTWILYNNTSRYVIDYLYQGWFRLMKDSSTYPGAAYAQLDSVNSICRSNPLNGPDFSRCGPGSIGLHLYASGTINWYDVPKGGTPLSTGSTFITPELDRDAVFFAEANYEGCVKPYRRGIMANIIDCAEEADYLGNKLAGRWYKTRHDNPCVHTPIIPVGGDSIRVTHVPSSDSICWRTYHFCRLLEEKKFQIVYELSSTQQTREWMLIENGERNPFTLLNPDLVVIANDFFDSDVYWYNKIDTFTQKELPRVISVQDGVRCGEGEVTLTAAADSGIMNWYADLTSDTVLYTDTVFTTPVLSSTTTYYVDAFYDDCYSPKLPVTAVIKKSPRIISVEDGARCGEGEVTLTAAADTGLINWYADLTGDTVLYTDTVFITPVLSNTTTYL